MNVLTALADELSAAYAQQRTDVIPPSARGVTFDLASAYLVQTELTKRRRDGGHSTVGRKVGYANKGVWRVFKLETVVWAPMFDDTVRYAAANASSLSIEHMCSPKIEPEIVFRMKKPLGAGDHDPATVLDSVEWLALGFEIIDCVFADWKFQPTDFVASLGLHAGLVVGEPLHIEPEMIPALVDQLPRFTVRLAKDGELVDEGSGRNSLRSPALCLGELASAIARQPGAEPLAAGELVSSGTLTDSHPITPGEAWTATIEGLDLAALTLRV